MKMLALGIEGANNPSDFARGATCLRTDDSRELTDLMPAFKAK
jgi:hypothetical protein